ncbi:MAG: cysteine desulfurase family protein [Nitrososphaerales archaeon]
MIYLDNAETTAVDPEVAEIVLHYMVEKFGLPGGEFGHSLQEEATEAVEKAREVIAWKVGAEPSEIIFTSGATESNNLALKGVVQHPLYKRKKVLTSAIEHKSVLDTALNLRRLGYQVEVLPVDSEGFVKVSNLLSSLSGAGLVSIQHANQEIGTLQDIKVIGELCRERGVLFHTDAAQSFTKEEINVKALNIDLMSITSHLIHGPKGVGALYVREGIELQPLIEGDGRERGLRAGSQNVPAIVGFAEAVKRAKQEDAERMRKLRDRLINNLLQIEDSKLNGATGERRVCHNVNVTFKYVEGEALLLQAEMHGLVCNTGSACYSQRLEPSHVITAIGGTHEDAHGSMRLSLSKMTTQQEVDLAAEILGKVVNRLRSFSPLAKRRS